MATKDKSDIFDELTREDKSERKEPVKRNLSGPVTVDMSDYQRDAMRQAMISTILQAKMDTPGTPEYEAAKAEGYVAEMTIPSPFKLFTMGYHSVEDYVREATKSREELAKIDIDSLFRDDDDKSKATTVSTNFKGMAIPVIPFSIPKNADTKAYTRANVADIMDTQMAEYVPGVLKAYKQAKANMVEIYDNGTAHNLDAMGMTIVRSSLDGYMTSRFLDSAMHVGPEDAGSMKACLIGDSADGSGNTKYETELISNCKTRTDGEPAYVRGQVANAASAVMDILRRDDEDLLIENLEKRGYIAKDNTGTTLKEKIARIQDSDALYDAQTYIAAYAFSKCDYGPTAYKALDSDQARAFVKQAGDMYDAIEAAERQFSKFERYCNEKGATLGIDGVTAEPIGYRGLNDRGWEVEVHPVGAAKSKAAEALKGLKGITGEYENRFDKTDNKSDDKPVEFNGDVVP